MPSQTSMLEISLPKDCAADAIAFLEGFSEVDKPIESARDPLSTTMVVLTITANSLVIINELLKLREVISSSADRKLASVRNASGTSERTLEELNQEELTDLVNDE